MTNSTFIDDVEHMNLLGQVRKPCRGFDTDRVGFYTGMQLEELAEKISAIALGAVSNQERDELNTVMSAMDRLGARFKEGDFQSAIFYADREALLDADIDIAVVTFGSASYQTPSYRLAAHEVTVANLAKFPGGVVTRDPKTNKIMKPEGWKAPDLSKYIVPRED